MLPKLPTTVIEPGVVRGARRRRVAAGLVALVVATTAGWAVDAAPAGAVTLDEAKAAVVAAQQDADAAAARYEAAIDRYETLAAAVATLEARIESNRAQVRVWREIARQRAVSAYIGHDSDVDGFLTEGGHALDAARREQLLARTRERENTAIDQMQALSSDLKTDRADLERQRVEQERVLADVEAEQVQVQAKLGEAQRSLDALEALLREIEEAQKAKEIAASIARSASSRSNGKNYSGVDVVTGIVCPIRGRGVVHRFVGGAAPSGRAPRGGSDVSTRDAERRGGVRVRDVQVRRDVRQRRVPARRRRPPLLLLPPRVVRGRGRATSRRVRSSGTWAIPATRATRRPTLTSSSIRAVAPP